MKQNELLSALNIKLNGTGTSSKKVTVKQKVK